MTYTGVLIKAAFGRAQRYPISYSFPPSHALLFSSPNMNSLAAEEKSLRKGIMWARSLREEQGCIAYLKTIGWLEGIRIIICSGSMWFISLMRGGWVAVFVCVRVCAFMCVLVCPCVC